MVIYIVGQKDATAVYGMATGIIGIAVVIFGLFGGVISDKTRLRVGRRRFWMIAAGKGQKKSTPAYFDWFDYSI